MQKIIRDDEMGGLFMIPLFVDWKIRRCNVKGCKNIPSTILTKPHPEISAMGLCEDHYQANLTEDGILELRCSAEFDNFDAFDQSDAVCACGADLTRSDMDHGLDVCEECR